MKKRLPAITLWSGLYSILIGLSVTSGQIQIPASQYAIPSEVFKSMSVPQVDASLILGQFREAESLRGKIGQDGAFRVRVSRQGGFIIVVGKEAYIVGTQLSYPGPKLGWTSMGFGRAVNEGELSPLIEKDKNGDVVIRDRERLKAYLARKKIKVISFAPWVDYDNFHPGLGRNLTRPEMKALLQEAMAAYKHIDPDILCLGSMEGNFVSPPQALQKYLWDSAPVALGFRPRRYGPGYEENYAKVIMKGAISYLRHGILYYHYQTEIPESGAGAGEYGAINHMFPITIEEIHAGWIMGKERIVTCVSGTFAWKGSQKPRVLVYDLAGRPIEARAEFIAKSGGWTVNLRLDDWNEIAVISLDTGT